MVGETGFPTSENQFFSPFLETPVSFFPSNRKVFFYEILHSGRWKRIFRLFETVIVCSEFFLLLETVTKINGSQFLKKDHILTNEILIFGLVETSFFHFLRQQSIATSASSF